MIVTRQIRSALYGLGMATLSLLLCPSPAMSQQFQNPAYYKAGKNSHAYPYSVVAVDVNNDHLSDLVIADFFESQVRILLNKGNGTFEPGKSFSVPAPVDVAIADLNADGNSDLVILQGGDSLVVYLGKGDGTFRKGSSYSLGAFIRYITVADFNRDGNIDVAVSFGGGKSGGINVLFGDGKGKLKKNATYKLGGQLAGIAAADLNGDGVPDLAVAEYQNEAVAILINQGDGKFGKAVAYSTQGGGASNVAIADLNHDGIPDLAVSTELGLTGFNIFLGTGHGKFKLKAFYSDSNPIQLAIADFNLDGNLDVIEANNTAAASVFYGNGDGTFAYGFSIGTTYRCGFSVTTADFDKDGAPDVAFTLDNINKLAVLLNKQ